MSERQYPISSRDSIGKAPNVSPSHVEANCWSKIQPWKRLAALLVLLSNPAARHTFALSLGGFRPPDAVGHFAPPVGPLDPQWWGLDEESNFVGFENVPKVKPKIEPEAQSSSGFLRSVDIRDDGRVFIDGKPLRLSPSAVSTWKQCPLLFKRRYIDKIPEPVSEAMIAGTLVHESLATLFEQEPQARTREFLQNHFREAWRNIRETPKYRELFLVGDDSRSVEDVEREKAWGLKAFKAFDSYLDLEDPTTAPQPTSIEERISLTLNETLGLDVVGIIDRLDISPADAGGLVITDYKTGKSPSQKYSAKVNERIRKDAFFQLEIYALLLRELGRTATEMRLMYLGDGAVLTQEVNSASMDHADAVLQDIWQQVVAFLREEASSQKAFFGQTGPLCDFCFHKDSCDSFAAKFPKKAQRANAVAESKSASSFVFEVEYAKSSRARCKACKGKIDKDLVRVGIVDGAAARSNCAWHHFACFPTAKGKTWFKKHLMEENDENVIGLDELKPEDRELVLTLFKACRGEVPVPEMPAGATTSADTLTLKGKKHKATGEELTDEQVDAISKAKDSLKGRSVAFLGALLTKNGLPKAGTKDLLLERIAECQVLGVPPICPQCGRKKLTWSRETGEFFCPGFFDSESQSFKRCSGPEKGAIVERTAWEEPE